MFLGNMCLYAEAITYATWIVQLYEKSVPRNPGFLQIVYLLSAVRRLAARMTDDDILDLPSVTDLKAKYLLKLYSRIGAYGVMIDRCSLRVWCALRAVQLSFVHGLSSATPMALALVGVVEIEFGNFKAAARFGQLSTRLVVERALGPEATAQTYSTASCYVLHWSASIDGAISTLTKTGMEVGLLRGELEYGFFSGTLHFVLNEIRGLPLEVVERDASDVCLKMKEFKVEGTLNVAKPQWQYVLNLLGQSANPLVLTGKAMNETEHLNDPMIAGSITQRLILTCQKFRLARLLGSYELAEQQATVLTKQFKDYTFKVGFVVYDVKFNLALLWYYCARQSQRRRQRWQYLLKARHEVMFMRRARKTGCPNFDTMLPLLEAEEASCVLSEQPLAVDALYVAAIASASGKPHHQAIALEQTALYHIGRDDMAAGWEYMRQAVKAYLEWNAHAKVAALIDKFGPRGMVADDNTIARMTLCIPTEGGASFAE